MGKFLFLIVVVLAVYWWLRRPSSPDPIDRDRSRTIGETMVRCEYCGLHIPSGEALTFDGRTYCSEDHRDRAGQSRHG